MSFLIFLNMIGGLALFLFGMNIMSDNLQAAAGNEMKRILKKLTNTPLKGVIVGLAVTSIIQSSSATTVMLIGLVNAGIMALSQAVGVIMGANIGTTVTAQLIAFKIGNYAYLFVIIGVILLFARKNRIMEKWSMVILGFGLLFIGLNVMSDAVKPLQNSQMAKDILVNLTSNPFMGILAGTIFTMIIQSSSASIGIVIVLATNHLIPYEGALYLVFGDNIGTTITAWLAALSVNRTSKRVAMIHTLFNVFGTIVFGFLTYIGIYTLFINKITPGNILAGENIARHIANAHTFFNVLNTIIFLPFAGLLAKLACKIIPGDTTESISMGEPRHLDYHLINSPELAIEQSIAEMREMLRLVKLSIGMSMHLFLEKNYRKMDKIEKIENATDNLQKEITLYLVSISEKSNSDVITKKIPSLLHTVNDLEKLGDHALQVSEILNNQILCQKTPFFSDFMKEIDELHKKIVYMIDLSLEYMKHFDQKHSYMIIELEGRINQYHQDMRRKVLDMIQNAECDAVSGINMIDYIDMVEVIADKLKNIVKAGTHNFIYQIKEHAKPEIL